MAKKKERTIEDDAQDMLESYGIEKDESGKEITKEIKDKIAKGNKLQGFINKKKKSFKETKYRKKYDGILDYMEKTLMNTVTYNNSLPSASTNVAYSFIYEGGSYTQIPMINRNLDNESNRVPTSNNYSCFCSCCKSSRRNSYFFR
jgi:hypothetical protein